MIKQANQKLARGQMVYAPISSAEKQSKSPFLNKKASIHNQSHSEFQKNEEKLYLQSSNHQRTPSKMNLQEQNQLHIEILLKQNESFRSKEEIYISKLMHLQQGLEKQHQQFMNLQQLYTELFNSYKQKQQQIAERKYSIKQVVQLRYKQTERQRVHYNSFQKNNTVFTSIEKMNSLKHSIVEENFKQQLSQLILQNKRLNQINEKLVTDLNYLRSKDKLSQSSHQFQQKVFSEMTDWQGQLQLQKQQKIKFQYENKFLRLRIQDLQKSVGQLQKILSLKQGEIIRMREEKMNIRRQSSEKVLKSPPKSSIESSRIKNGQTENKKLTSLIQNLQKQNHNLREQNLSLKQKLKGGISKQSFVKTSSLNEVPIARKLNYFNEDKITGENSLQNYHNQNFNSQNTNQQYFSFSRQKQQRSSQEQDLPSFPMDLEIEGIIQRHQGNIKEDNQEIN